MLANHHPFSNVIFSWIVDYLCVESQLKAGDCAKYANSEELKNGVVMNLYTDQLSKTTKNWTLKANIPWVSNETPWSSKTLSWLQAYEIHKKNIETWEYNMTSFIKF